MLLYSSLNFPKLEGRKDIASLRFACLWIYPKLEGREGIDPTRFACLWIYSTLEGRKGIAFLRFACLWISPKQAAMVLTLYALLVSGFPQSWEGREAYESITERAMENLIIHAFVSPQK